MDRYTPLGSYGVLPFRLNYNKDGSLKRFEEHEVLFARKSGKDSFRQKAKQAEGAKGHRRDNDPERNTPVKTAVYHASHEAGWSTNRDFTKPGKHVIVRLFDGPGSRCTGQVIAGVTSINEIPKIEEEKTEWREGSAMIAVVHDEAKDEIGQPEDGAFGRAEWYKIKNVIAQCWGHKNSWRTGDVKGYWKDFFENLSKENIFHGNVSGLSGSNPFALGKTTEEQKRPLTPEPADQGRQQKRTLANLGGIDSHVLHRLGNFASPILFQLARVLYHHVGLQGNVWLTEFVQAVQNDQDEDSIMLKKMFQHTRDPRNAASVQSVGIHDFVKKAFRRDAGHSPDYGAACETCEVLLF